MQRKIVTVSGQQEFVELMQSDYNMTMGQAGALYGALLHTDKLLIGDTWIVFGRKVKVS